MKSLFSLALLLASAIASAADIPLAETACANTVCFDPAPDVAYVGTDSTFSSAMASYQGTLYTGTTTAKSSVTSGSDTYTTIAADLHSATGASIRLVATFRRWKVTVRSGRGQTTRSNYELVSGAIAS